MKNVNCLNRFLVFCLLKRCFSDRFISASTKFLPFKYIFFVTLKQIFDIYVMHYFPFFINNVYVAFVVVHQKSQCEKKLQCAINTWSRGSTFIQIQIWNRVLSATCILSEKYIDFLICRYVFWFDKTNDDDSNDCWWWRWWCNTLMRVSMFHIALGAARVRRVKNTQQYKTRQVNLGTNTHTHSIDVLGEVNTRCQYLTTVNFFSFNFDAKNEQKKLYQIGRCIC